MRKRAYCVLVMDGIQTHLISILKEFGLQWTDLASRSPEALVGFLQSVPTLDVEITLFTERNEHRDRRIDPNDEIDIGFLSLATPCCDLIATEKFWATHRTNLDRKYGTYVGHDLNDLLASLRDRIKCAQSLRGDPDKATSTPSTDRD
ncbi:MAG: hypothetical protein ABSE45_02305 [Candidatus Acidiferrales bacterium]|jgi:hypothetical protein